MRLSTIVMTVFTVLAAGCGARIGLDVDRADGSGASGRSGEGGAGAPATTTVGPGGGAPGPRPMAIDVAGESSPGWCGEWQKPLAGVEVFSSNPDGSLLDEARTDGGGRATLLTMDGGFVSAVRTSPDGLLPATMSTVATTADVPRLHFGFADNHVCSPEPMHVHVEVPPQPGGAPVVAACDAFAEVDTTTWSAELDFVKCSYDGMFTVLLLPGSGDVPVIGASPKTQWVEGGAATVAIETAPPEVEVRVLSKNTDVVAVEQTYWVLDAEGTEWKNDAFSVEASGADASLTWAVGAVPGMQIQTNYGHQEGSCGGTTWILYADASVLAAQPTTVDPSRLARPTRDSSGAWLLDDGDLGHAVRALRRFGTEDHDVWWDVTLPAAARVTLPSLALPDAVRHFFPTTRLSESMDNFEIRGAASYADLLQRLEPRSWGDSLIEEYRTGCGEP